jgi:hypothetical protein
MSYTYISQKFREYDFWLRESRILPEDLPRKIRDTIIAIEEGYRAGFLERRKAVVLATILKERFGYPYRVVSDRHIVIIPRSHRELMRAFLMYPQLIALIGNRHAGKTITAWTIALEALQKKPEMRLYVYGDVDGLGEQVMKMRPELEDRIIVKEDYRLPPLDGREKIVIYNELSESLISKRALSSANLELNLQALRSRHLNTWVIYNVIRFSSLESVLRETADIKMFKWLSPELVNNAMMNLPKGWAEILKVTTKLSRNEGLVIAPVQGKGVKIFLHETNPPAWLLEAHRRAKKDSKLMMVKSERKRYVLQRIGELYEKGLSTKEIKMILENEGINLSERSIRMKRKQWEELVSLEKNK